MMVQLSVPVAPEYTAVIETMPALTPTTMPAGLTVAKFEFSLFQTASAAPIERFVPSEKVTSADICTELVRDMPQGAGESDIAETVADDVEDPTQDAQSVIATAAIALKPHVAKMSFRYL
jgi:hypothetical protein